MHAVQSRQDGFVEGLNKKSINILLQLLRYFCLVRLLKHLRNFPFDTLFANIDTKYLGTHHLIILSMRIFEALIWLLTNLACLDIFCEGVLQGYLLYQWFTTSAPGTTIAPQTIIKYSPKKLHLG